jgi:tetratricopeptide (TPR) repeat protein
VQTLCQLLDEVPNDPLVHSRLAQTHAQQRDYAQAVQHYAKSISLYLGRNENDRAVSCYAELRHYFPGARLNLATEFQLARYLLQIHCHKPAITLFESIIETYPQAPEAEVCHLQLGDLHLNQLNDPVAAVKYYDRFLRSYPHSPLRGMGEKRANEARSRLP